MAEISAIPTRTGGSSWFTASADRANRNIAAEAFRNAIKHLETEVGLTSTSQTSPRHPSSIHEVHSIVEEAQRKYEEESKRHTGARRWLERLSLRIMHYGRVLDMLAQHHPEYVALAWGAVKLVLMGVLNRADLTEKIAQALVEIGDILPRAHLSAELYHTERMEAALTRLYTYMILFIQLCLRWYNRSSLGRLWSSLKTPFELDYCDLALQIKQSSTLIEDLSNAGAREELRHIRVYLELHHTRSMDNDAKLLKMLSRSEASTTELIKASIENKSIIERIDTNTLSIAARVSRIEFHHVVQFFTPKVLPCEALHKVQSFCNRNPISTLPTYRAPKIERTLREWVLHKGSALQIVQSGLGAQAYAKQIAAEVLKRLSTRSEYVLWNLSLACSSKDLISIATVLKSILYQILKISGGHSTQFTEHLNLAKIQSNHTEQEWADLLSLLLSNVPQAFVVLETEDLSRAYRHDPDWTERFLGLLQSILDRSTLSGNELKILWVVGGVKLDSQANLIKRAGVSVASLQSPPAVPPRLRHIARRHGLNTTGWTIRKPKV